MRRLNFSVDKITCSTFVGTNAISQYFATDSMFSIDTCRRNMCSSRVVEASARDRVRGLRGRATDADRSSRGSMNALVRFTKLQGRVPSWVCAARKASHTGPALCFVLPRHVHSAIDRTSPFPTPPRAHSSSIPRVLLSDSLGLTRRGLPRWPQTQPTAAPAGSMSSTTWPIKSPASR